MLPDRSILIGQILVENTNIQKFKCDILSNFQLMCIISRPKYGSRKIEKNISMKIEKLSWTPPNDSFRKTTQIALNCLSTHFISGLKIFWKNDHFSTSFAERSFRKKRWLMVVEHYNQKRTFVGSTLENFKQMREMQRRTKRIIFLPTFFPIVSP